MRLCAALLALGLCTVAQAAPPQRVVSMNLCTDQLALMLAGPEQLVSVSVLAADARMSPMAKAATGLPVNHGLAEEIFALNPDVVLAGSFSNPATLGLLRRLGLRVETFEPASDLPAIRMSVLRMGAVLGREADAMAMVRRFDADVAALGDVQGPRPRAASYSANSYSEGADSLAGQIIALAGYDNVTGGIGGTLPLERLVMEAPDLIVRSADPVAPSRAEAVLDHPVLRDLAPQVRTGSDWICGTPHILNAAARLRAAGP